jgi:hypothetical protein
MIKQALLASLVLAAISGCAALSGGSSQEQPTLVAVAPSLTASPPGQLTQPAEVPATFTPDLSGEFASPTSAQLATFTPFATHTPFPTRTATAEPTSPPTHTPEATPTSLPTATPNLEGVNLLPNPSFEQGWYHVSNYAEIQVPDQWVLGWREGKNSLDSDPWNVFVRPESRLLNGDFLPADEIDLFIWEGNYTVKVFKGQGSLYFWLTTNVTLDPGSYLFEINVFPDMIEGYNDIGAKKWASDPLSGELRFIEESEVGNWTLPKFGQKQSFHHAFEVTEERSVRLGVAFRGRWAIENNGWFLDDWSLIQLSPAEEQVDEPEASS